MGIRLNGFCKRTAVREHYQVERLLPIRPRHRFDCNLEGLSVTVVVFEPQPFSDDLAVLLDGIAESRAEVEPNALARHGDKLAIGRACRRLQILAGARRK